MSKILTVFGATGNQGGSVVKTVLAHPTLSKTYKIRAVTRNLEKPAAVALKNQGVEVVSADLSDKDAVFKAVQGSSVVFGVTDFWNTLDGELETQQGRNIADASKATNVERFIFSSLVNVSRESKGKNTSVKHFDSKAKVEEYAREIGVPGSYVLPGVFMSGLFDWFRKGDDGTYTWATPLDVPTAKLPLFDPADDTGRFVGAILLDLPGTLNKRILGTSGWVTPDEAAATFEQVSGQKAKAQKISLDQFKSFLPPSWADELAANMQLIDAPGYYVGEPEGAVEGSIELVAKHPELGTVVSWKEYVAKKLQK